MPQNDFESGATVALKSGSPVMTIKWAEDGEAYCEWFDVKTNKGAKFSLTQLVKKDPD